MTEKQKRYVKMAEQLGDQAGRDVWLMENYPDVWETARVLDDWLFAYRDNERVGLEQYARNCAKLEAIYLPSETAQEPQDGSIAT